MDNNMHKIKITGYLHQNVKKISYIAAMPAEKRITFTGSCLPFANSLQAFENTHNKGDIKIQGDSFTFTIYNPNSYYMGLGSVLIPPTIHLVYETENGDIENVSIIVNNPIPYRNLTYPDGQFTIARDKNFYFEQGERLPVRTQESILRSAGYPIKTRQAHANFWGKKPPL